MSQNKHFPVPGDSSVYSFVPQLKPVFRQGAQGDVIDSLTRICANILQVLRNFLIFIAYNAKPFITGASQRLEPVIKCSLFLSFFQCLVSRAPLSAVTKSLS